MLNQFSVINIFLLSLIFSNLLFAQYPNIQVSDVSSHDPEEVTIAINPTNPQNLAAGANLNYYYYSFDGGWTWTEGRLSSQYGVWGDPCVIFDGDGKLLFAHLSSPPSSEGDWLDRIVVQKSYNDGKSWNRGEGIGLNPPKDQDKEWLAVDITESPFRNRIYMAWTEFDRYGSNSPRDSSRILFSHSCSNGWTEPVRISDRGGDCIDSDNTVEGAVPAVGPNGEVYISWSGPLGILFDKSTDGGDTFGSDAFVTSQPGGWDFNVPGISRCNGFPVTACDISHSPYRGTIYILWSDQRNGMDNTDVFLIKSSDDGETWSDIKKINDDDSGRHQFFPWLSVDPMTGYIYIVFYDRRNTVGNQTDVHVAKSTNGGATFVNFKVNESSFDPTANIFFGDYTNIAVYNGMVYPIWMRMDGNRLSVWTAIISDTITSVSQEIASHQKDFALSQNYPNPFNMSTEIQFSILNETRVVIDIYDMQGKHVRQLINKKYGAGTFEIDWNGTDDFYNTVTSGVYLYRIKTEHGEITRKMILLQ